ncbi:MAG: BON domain-containing protein [Bacteroidetes bacterium]|nr:BON domain-containing protein [Bacteroidota bacterium]HET6245012.1 BON domain-containing protein [Bacteroidia bacterium]
MEQSEVKKAIKDQFIWDDRILSANINVEILDGTVRLSGEVPDFSSRKAAEEDALSISGVNRVENNIEVTYPESVVVPTDEQVMDILNELLSLDDGIDADSISVSVNDGVATVKGTVDAYWKKNVIKGYAFRITGIKEVIDSIIVSRNRIYSDQEIVSDIKKAFERNDYHNTRNIKVDVKNRIVTLSGKVPSHLARMRVNEIVNYTSGVCEIVDNLSIEKQASYGNM